MHSTTIFLLAFGLMAGVAMARPGRPWSGHHHETTEGGVSSGQHGYQSSAYRVPKYIRLPLFLAEKLGRPVPTYTAKKILDGKYLLISPALMFKIKTDTSATTTQATRPTTTEEPETPETTAPAEESTTPAEESTTPDEESTTSEGSGEETTTPEPTTEESTTAESGEESTTPTPSFFKKRSFSINNNEQLLFLED